MAAEVAGARRGRAAGSSLSETVRAAGGVVVRTSGGGEREVLLVHRPQYGDWSFPKGKVEPGETDEECAAREVEEETGLRCSLRRELPPTEYLDAKQRPKTVRYWIMEVIGGTLLFDFEVDDARWVTLPVARELLTYPRDVELLGGVGSGEPSGVVASPPGSSGA